MMNKPTSSQAKSISNIPTFTFKNGVSKYRGKLRRHIKKVGDQYVADYSVNKITIDERSFSSHVDAKRWFATEIKTKVMDWDNLPFAELAEVLTVNPNDKDASMAWSWRMEVLKNIVAEEEMYAGCSDEHKAIKLAKERCGAKRTIQIEKGLSGALDALMDELENKSIRSVEDLVKDLDGSSFMQNPSQLVISEQAKELLATIREIPGEKIVTILVNEDGQYKYDISADGVVGYVPSHETNFLLQVQQALNGHGVLWIRQFIPNSKDVGGDSKIPWKCLYSIFLQNHNILLMSAEQVESAYVGTKKENEKEKVIFGDISEFVADER